MEYLTKSYKQTQRLGEKLALRLCLRQAKEVKAEESAAVLGLQGNLGGGKTTFLQGFAKGLGIKEKILSPTFVIIKRFKIRNRHFKNFYHMDCYRINNIKDIETLGLGDIISNPENIVAIEWPEKIKKILPKSIIAVKFDFIYSERNQRLEKDKRKVIVDF